MSRANGGRAGVIFVIGLLALAPLILVVNRQVLLRKLAEERERIRREGYPVTLEELNAWYPQPVGTNAADLYLEAFRLMDTWETNKVVVMERPPQRRRPGSQPKEVVGDLVPVEKLKRKFLPLVGDANLPPVTESLPNDMLVLVREFLADNAAAWRILDAAAEVREARYPIDLRHGPSLPLPHIEKLRHLGQLLALEAIAAAEDGDPVAAERAISSIWMAARSLEQEPLLRSQWSYRSLVNIAIDAQKRVANRTVLTELQLGKLQHELENSLSPQLMVRALVGQRVLYSAVDLVGVVIPTRGGCTLGSSPSAEDLLDFVMCNIGEQLQTAFTGFYYVSGLLDADRLCYLQGMRELIKAGGVPYPQRFGEISRVSTAVTQLSRWRLLSRSMLEPSSSDAVRDAGLLALARSAATALAVERYRLRTGALPMELGELVPEFLPALPVDPYTGDPLRYYRAERCFVVYSVGADRTDDGAREKDAKGRTYQPGTDITFSVER